MSERFADMTDEQLREIAEMNPRDVRTLGGRFLDEHGNPTGHKLRHQNEARVLARMDARQELARRASAPSA